MKQLTHEINLNMTQPNNFEYVYAMQSDYDSEIVVATLYAGNTLYTIDANQAVLNGVTENGNTIVYNNVTIDSDKHRISFPLTKEMLFESGDTRFVVSFFDTRNNQRKSAFPFIIKSISDAEGTLPVSVLKKVSEYVAEAAASAQEAKESAKNAKDSATNAQTSELNAKDSENNAKKYATEAKSYAVGGTGTRKNEDIQNTQYYYNVIKELFDQHLEQILYYTDYASFEKDYNAEKITPRTLVLIAEGGESDNGNATNPYCVNVILANNMTRVETSGSLKQYVKGSKTIDEIIINANSGYYFPDDYECAGTVNGIVIARNNENQITISGSPTKNTEIMLITPSNQAAGGKGEQSAPTGLSDGGGQINGTTVVMEYSSDNITWKTCYNNRTIVDTGTYYVRYKETDTLNASPSVIVKISEYKVIIPNGEKIYLYNEGDECKSLSSGWQIDVLRQSGTNEDIASGNLMITKEKDCFCIKRTNLHNQSDLITIQPLNKWSYIINKTSPSYLVIEYSYTNNKLDLITSDINHSERVELEENLGGIGWSTIFNGSSSTASYGEREFNISKNFSHKIVLLDDLLLDKDGYLGLSFEMSSKTLYTLQIHKVYLIKQS